MADDTGGAEPKPLPPADLAVWRRIVADGHLSRCPIEEVIAAAQALGPATDRRVIEAMMKHISDEIMHCLRRLIGRNHPNEGWDMIERAHTKLIDGVLLPGSPDGAALRSSFRVRVWQRAADAIRAERRNTRRHPAYETDDDGDPVEPPAAFSWNEVDEQIDVDAVLKAIEDPRKRFVFRLHMEEIRSNQARERCPSPRPPA